MKTPPPDPQYEIARQLKLMNLLKAAKILHDSNKITDEEYQSIACDIYLENKEK